MKKEKRDMRAIDGFVTIEYTFLIPVLMVVFIFVVYMGLYQYNQCLLRTNMYILGCEGARLCDEDASSKIRKLQGIEKNMYYDKYLFVEDMKTAHFVKGTHVELQGSGKMSNPLATLGIGGSYWELKASCEADAVNGVEILRLHKVSQKMIHGMLSEEEMSDDS